MTASTAKATTCRLKELRVQGLERLRKGAVFWPYNWRSKLCTCTSCKVAQKKASFLNYNFDVDFNVILVYVLV